MIHLYQRQFPVIDPGDQELPAVIKVAGNGAANPVLRNLLANLSANPAVPNAG